MFEQVLLGKDKERRPWTLALSVTLQVGVVGVLLLIPLIYTEAIPLGALKSAPLPPPPRGRPDAIKLVPAPQQQRASRISTGRLTAPTLIARLDTTPQPATGPAVDDSLPIAGVPWGIPDGPTDRRMEQILNAQPPPPAPPPPARAQQPAIVRRISTMQEALLISRPMPRYPHLAVVTRASGVVRLEAIISEQGTIEDLRVVSGHPLLVQAALDAVRQWRYRPTYLGGQPVRVSTTIDVNFALSH